MRNWIAVSHYTFGTRYQELARRLGRSLKALEIPNLIFPVPDLGSWQRNVHHKPAVIRAALNEMALVGYNLAYFDADAEVVRYPELFDDWSADFGGHWRAGLNELLPGTLILANNQRVRRLLEDWITYTEERPELSERAILKGLVERHRKEEGLHVQELPAQYAKIFDLMADVPDPVVVHYQASRQARAEIGAKDSRGRGAEGRGLAPNRSLDPSAP